ncbi:Membrane fusion protein use1 [Thalictrum thalictroides]|uniref:Membrane fusion protein use1 n=1 Tax=Thalictrum thalictroides TaxID=46969 RepID=A0A7J6X0S3_THATH|nr:Membrane fusion protein use1 [Thalictrum thalictroides]
MGISKTEINLRRLLNAAPRQQNQSKLMHYVTTLRELLEELMDETSPKGLPRISNAIVNDYSEKIEALAAKLASPLSDMPGSLNVDRTGDEQAPLQREKQIHVSPPFVRRRLVSHPKVESVYHDITECYLSKPVKLDAGAQAHIEKHRKFQEDLTDEMVELARKLKGSSLMMDQSLQEAAKLLDSTEKAVAHSLASTGHASAQAMEIYSQGSKTTCATWLIIFMMTCIFFMVVLLIRVT